MSRLYKCDLCGKIVEEGDGYARGRYEDINQTEIKYTKGSTDHVCNSCYKDYHDYDNKMEKEYKQKLLDFVDKMREKAGIAKPIEKSPKMDMPMVEK